MATSQYGLITTDPKKKFGLQVASGVDPNEDQSGNVNLPTANFSTLPTINAPSYSGTPTQVHAAAIPANFQFTGAYEAANRALSQQETDAALQRRQALADLDSQYRDVTQRGADLQSVARTQLQENLASRGLSMSGINAQASGQQEKSYNQSLADLASARAKALTGVEGGYADVLNQLARKREDLFYGQQKDEETKRLEAERLKAEAAAQQQQAAQQQAMLEQIKAAQESARQAAMAAAAASQLPSYSPPSLAMGAGSSYSGGGAQQDTGGYKAGEQRITMPTGANGMNEAGWTNWVHNNLDANASPAAVQAVLQQLMKDQPNGGTPISDIAWLIQQYPNVATSGGDKQYAAGGGRRF